MKIEKKNDIKISIIYNNANFQKMQTFMNIFVDLLNT